ncbi:MAG: hypothetical protein ACH36H_13130 [Candidatus Nanopelagicales bacterium]
MTADLVLTDTGLVLDATAVPAWLAHPANAGRVAKVQPLHPHGCDGTIPAAVAPPSAAAGLSTHHNN